MLIRSDSAGATYGFAEACREAGVGFSFGFPVTANRSGTRSTCWPTPPGLACLDGIDVWYPTINADGTIRDGAWVAEATDLVDLSAWPDREQGDPAEGTTTPRGAADVHRRRRASGSPRSSPTPRPGSCPVSWPVWTCGTASTPGSRTGSGRPRRPGMRNFPCHSYAANSAWLEIVMTAIDLVAWSKLLGFADEPDLATLRDRHVPLPGAARRRPDHPQRPAEPGSASTTPGGGPPDRRSLAPDPRRVHLTPASHQPQRPENPTPASGTGANPTRQSGPTPTHHLRNTASQQISPHAAHIKIIRARSRRPLRPTGRRWLAADIRRLFAVTASRWSDHTEIANRAGVTGLGD